MLPLLGITGLGVFVAAALHRRAKAKTAGSSQATSSHATVAHANSRTHAPAYSQVTQAKLASELQNLQALPPGMAFEAAKIGGAILGAVPFIGGTLDTLFMAEAKRATTAEAQAAKATPKPATPVNVNAQTGAQHLKRQRKIVHSMGSAGSDVIHVEGGSITEAQRALLE